MNWYKKSQRRPLPIAVTSYNQLGELGVSFNGGKTYIYPDITPFLREKIDRLLGHQNYSSVQKVLKNLSPIQKEKELEQQKQDEEEMYQELVDNGLLS